jgi:hypothetical protein
MALARIFTRYPQQAIALSDELQERGYTVEVLSPEQTSVTPAHLEIQLEACDPADILRRAEELAFQLSTDIAVAPGVLPVSTPQQELDSTPIAIAPEFIPGTIEPAIQPAALENEPRNCEPAEVVRPAHEAGPARAVGTTLGGFAAAAREFLSSARAGFHDCLGQARILAAEAHARHQERALELEHRRAEVRQHALTVENARRALAAYLLQLQREYPDILPDAGSQSATTAVRAAQGKTWRLRINIMKGEAALAVAVSATALFVAGIAVASFHSRPAPAAKPQVAGQPSDIRLPEPQAKPPSLQRPSPATRNAATRRPAPARGANHEGAHRKHHSRSDLVASDVVVRHFKSAKPTPTPQTGWKHFSDLNH